MNGSPDPSVVITRILGERITPAPNYPGSLPPEIAPWYCYTYDSRHSILVALEVGDFGDQPTRSQLEGKLIPVPVESVQRAGWRMTGGYVVCTLDPESANSYRTLTAEAARFFRLIGLHPGAEFGVSAVAALAGVGHSRAQHLLDVLVGAHLLTQTAPDRFEFHDLMRAYAIDQAQHEEPVETREAARLRALTWYLHAADAARTRVSPAEPPVQLEAPPDGVTPPAFADYDEAVRWYELEHGNLLAAARAAADAGLDTIAWQLPALLRPLHTSHNAFEEWFAMGHIGLSAARRAGDRAGEANLLESLGMACRQSHRPAEAARYHEDALTVRRDLGDRLGEALSLNALGLVHLRTRRLAEAERRFMGALALLQELGAAEWEPTLLSNLATVAYEAGRLEEASEAIHQALTTLRERGDKGEGNALRILSAVQRERGDIRKALETAGNAVEIARRHRNHVWEGYWLLDLGKAELADGRPEDALVSYQRAAVLHRQLGDRSREARAWNAAGEAYGRLGRFDEAATFHRRAAAAHRGLDDDWQLALALDGLANALRGSGMNGAEEEARRHWAEASRSLAAFHDARAAKLRHRIGRALGLAHFEEPAALPPHVSPPEPGLATGEEQQVRRRPIGP